MPVTVACGNNVASCAVRSALSVLLFTTMSFFPSAMCSIFSTSLSSGMESSIHSMIGASCIVLNVLSIPILSIVSSVSLMPAVSMSRNVIPSMFVVSSITSRVVPCMSLTIAFSSPTRVLRRVLFPTFVFPAIATAIPSFIALPDSNDLARLLMCLSISTDSSRSSVLSANSKSSWSEKSSSSSMSDVSFSNFSLSMDSWLEKFPLSCDIAIMWVALLVEAMRSATASAWLRSIFPLMKALFVYSPGSACLHPFSMRRLQILFITYLEPWQDISTESSPVYECGFLKILARTSSTGFPLLSNIVPKWMVFGLLSASFPPFPWNIRSAMPIALSPDILMIPIAPPVGVARAHIVL